MEAYRLVLFYLEWIRATRSAPPKPRANDRGGVAHERTVYAGSLRDAGRKAYSALKRATETPTGIKKLRRLLRAALANEYHMPPNAPTDSKTAQHQRAQARIRVCAPENTRHLHKAFPKPLLGCGLYSALIAAATDCDRVARVADAAMRRRIDVR